MNHANGNGLHLTGTGAGYLRVSGDRQEFQRQVDAIAAFEQRHRVKIAQHHRYEDHGLPRDLSAKRPDFQRMLKAARSGALQWIVVDQIDRFGFADEWELVEMIGQLRKAGCKLYDANGDDWTAHGLMSYFKAGLAGHSSHDEQVKKSYRALGGMVAKARAGEWQGGPVKLGFDVACFDRATGEELWRVVFEGRDVAGTTMRRGKERPVYRIRRLKVYPDGRTERLDGNVVFRTSKDTQRMQVVPTRDKAKLAAAQGVFRRYATEAVSFFDLAKWLNGLGIRNSFGNLFQANDIRKMLTDEAYLGYPTFSKRRNGRFHRHDADGGIVELEPELRGKDRESDPDDVIRSSARLFEPMVDRKTWDAVQKKLRGREKAGHAPKNPGLYLAGLVTCAGCDAPMVARTDRMEYYCGTWDKHRTRGDLANSPCERNGVKQSVLEEYVGRYLEETSQRLQLLTEGPDDRHLTDRLREQETEAWRAFRDGIARLTTYLATHHPDEYGAIVEEFARRDAEEKAIILAEGKPGLPPGSLAKLLGERGRVVCERGIKGPVNPAVDTNDFVEACVACYRSVFDPAAVEAELAGLRAEHDRLVERWGDLPTKRAKETAAQRLAELDARMGELERQQEDAADVVAAHYREMCELQRAVADARMAMGSEAGAQALRQRAEALRGLLVQIRCEFVLTGKESCGPGNARSKLVALDFLPVAGDAVRVEANGGQAYYAKP